MIDVIRNWFDAKKLHWLDFEYQFCHMQWAGRLFIRRSKPFNALKSLRFACERVPSKQGFMKYNIFAMAAATEIRIHNAIHFISMHDTMRCDTKQIDFIASWWLVTVWMDGLGCIKNAREEMHRDIGLLLTITKSIENNIIHCTECALIITWYAMCISTMQAIFGVNAYTTLSEKHNMEWKCFPSEYVRSVLCIARFDTMPAHFLTVLRLLLLYILIGFGNIWRWSKSPTSPHPPMVARSSLPWHTLNDNCNRTEMLLLLLCGIVQCAFAFGAVVGKMMQTDASDCVQCWQIPICYVFKSVPSESSWWFHINANFAWT